MSGRRRASLVVGVVILTAVLLFRWSWAHDEKAPVGPTQFTYLVPILNVKSVEESIEHYTTVLGFSRHWDWPNNDPNKTFASITNGKTEIYLCEGAQGQPGTWICYNVGDVDALHKQYQEKKADIWKTPADKPWGLREMLVRDIDGHVLRIGQPIPEKKDVTKEGL